MTASPTTCQSSPAGHPSAGDGKLLPETTIALGLFLRLTTTPYGQMLIPSLLFSAQTVFTAASS
jgi:hypothetical protein